MTTRQQPHQSQEVGRFAPSTTGPAHPGTLLAALLCWLDARSLGARVLLRLEDLDPERSRPEWSRDLLRDLAWLGLDWDEVASQSGSSADHAEALDRLEAMDLLYPCACTRSQIASQAQSAPDGGFRYPGTCRERTLGTGGWRSCGEPLRVRLADTTIRPPVFFGEELARNPFRDFGDPVVRRRDGVAAYHLACVVDDTRSGVTRVVRGRDLAFHAATQVALQQILELPSPDYAHHLLLLEQPAGRKLGKFHGAVAIDELRERYTAAELCGFLAHAAGLQPSEEPVVPGQLVAGFDWGRVTRSDRVVEWTGERLRMRA